MSRVADVMYREHCRDAGSDICEHLGTLYALARECSCIVELGVRDVVSSWALLRGLRDAQGLGPGATRELVCLDIQPPTDDMQCLVLVGAACGVTARHVQSDSAAPDALAGLEYDALFVDTWHCYGHLRRELAAHHGRARKYIVMHDTETFGWTAEGLNPATTLEDLARKTRDSGYSLFDVVAGLRPAVNEFLATHPEWEMSAHFVNNNGLTVLRRVGPAPVAPLKGCASESQNELSELVECGDAALGPGGGGCVDRVYLGGGHGAAALFPGFQLPRQA